MKTTNMMLTSLFMYFNHPLILTIIILTQTTNSCLIMGTHMKNFWIPYLLFIIMLGGLMIMFMYMCSTTPNQLMKSPTYTLLISLLTMIIFMTINKMYWKDKLMKMNYSTLSMNSTNNFFNMLINFPTQFTFMLMMMFLAFSMFTTMKISFTSNKPLRSMM
uniref:NADH dehydrogenase subunit 6 n=1 Tax=Aposthonia japonica TaxID=911381 RepID=H7CD28_9NEOP|nr:NADH dehydrogenase subunit 6 [Aposthonia japonica]